MTASRIAELEAALRPFAEISPYVQTTHKRDGERVHEQRKPDGTWMILKRIDFRRAAAALSAPAAPEGATVEPVAWRHTIKEPDVTELLMLSQSPENPWSHWIAEHRDKCTYTCEPLYAASPPPAALGVEEVARAIDPDAWYDDMPIPTRSDTLAFHERRQASCATASRVLAAIRAKEEGL